MSNPFKSLLRRVFNAAGYEIRRRTQATKPGDAPPFRTDELGMESTFRGLVLRGFQPNQVLDVGAASGAWTELALSYWPDARYYLIEPLREHQATLDALAAKHPNVSYRIAACGDKVGSAEISVSSDLYGSSFHQPGLPTRNVELVTLDSLLEAAAIAPPDLIKMDIQGHEFWALAGAPRVLSQARLVLLECIMHPFQPSMKLLADLVISLKNSGFIPYEIVDTLRRAHSGAMGQCDVLFAKEGDPLIDNKFFIYPQTGTLFPR